MKQHDLTQTSTESTDTHTHTHTCWPAATDSQRQSCDLKFIYRCKQMTGRRCGTFLTALSRHKVTSVGGHSIPTRTVDTDDTGTGGGPCMPPGNLQLICMGDLFTGMSILKISSEIQFSKLHHFKLERFKSI